VQRLRGLTAAVILGVIALTASFTAAPTASAAVVPSAPTRVLDTRTGVGAPRGLVGPGAVVRINPPAGAGGAALVMNVTATDALGWGFATVWSCNGPRPGTSNLNFVPGRAVANMVIVAGGSAVCLDASAPVHLIADFMGSATAAGDVTPTSPNRIVDTRRTGNPLRAGEFRRIRVGGTVGVPAGSPSALLNVTMTETRSPGFASVVPCPAGAAPAPSTSTLNFLAGDTYAGFTIAALAGDELCVFSSSAGHLIVDTFGWAPATGGLRTKAPERVLDTRNGIWSTGPAMSNADVRVRVAGRGGVPNESAAALLTVTVADTRSAGYVTAWSCDVARPNASILNFTAGAARANSVLVGLSVATGEVCLSAVSYDGSPVSLIADAVGFVPGTLSRPPVPPPPAPTRFGTVPVGAALPSGALCATLVRPAPEVRAVNAPYNVTRGTRPNTVYPRVDGNFTGTTDQVIQWVACKWGIDEDVVRAQIARESWWTMTAVGDNGESFGLGQVRVPYHQSAFVDDNAKRSSAYNLDYTYAVWRECFEGRLTWLNTVERGATYGAGDLKGCLGVWFSGRWYTQPAREYIAAVDSYLAQRIWQQSYFING
jgi:hypothetical protein